MRIAAWNAVACVLVGGLASAATAAELFTLNVSGAGNLLRVDQQTGAATPLAPEDSLGPGSWSGLSASATDSSVLYAVNNPLPPNLDAPQFSHLARIDLTTATASLFPAFDTGELGYENVFSSALAISPLDPDIAVVAGFDRSFPPQRLLWTADVRTGQVRGPGIEIASNLAALTFGPDGVTLYGTDSDGQLLTVNPDTGDATVVGDPGLSNFLTGLAFHPQDGTLFATEGFREDRLVILDASSGSLVTEIGPLGIPGPEGLAFVPEPGALALLLVGLPLLVRRRFRQPSREHRGQRAHRDGRARTSGVVG
jgi:hypothetical protein